LATREGRDNGKGGGPYWPVGAALLAAAPLAMRHRSGVTGGCATGDCVTGAAAVAPLPGRLRRSGFGSGSAGSRRLSRARSFLGFCGCATISIRRPADVARIAAAAELRSSCGCHHPPGTELQLTGYSPASGGRFAGSRGAPPADRGGLNGLPLRIGAPFRG
jgi:hypothetical protein